MTLVAAIGPVIDRYPVLITQHMPPTFTTILAEHLARAAGRPAQEGVDHETVKPGHIYLATGGRHMRVTKKGTSAVIVLDDGPAVNFCKPAVDPLFTSAIDVWQGGVLAVILTGMGSDGMRGGKQIVAAGGNVIAQDEASSVVWGMPGAAAHDGICAAILPLQQIASETGSVICGRPFVTPLDFEYLRKFLKDRSGLDLAVDKQYLVESRLIPLARKAGLSGIGELVQKMKNGAEALMVDVVEAMTTNETFFFRDKTPFEHLRETMLPALLQARAARRSLRIWCAAGSTGQEPYSIAMCLKEYGPALGGWRTEIIATDLRTRCSKSRKAGLYSQFEVQRGLPIQLLIKISSRSANLADQCRHSRDGSHRQLNLLQDFSNLGTFDVIFCRNVLIYFDQETKVGVFTRLAKRLEDDGPYAGAAETVVGLTNVFKPHSDKRGLYRLNSACAPSLVPGMPSAKAAARA